MKEALWSVAKSINHVNPEACFSFELWNGDRIAFGRPNVSLILKNKYCLKRIMKDGFFGLGESYMSGDLDIKGDILELCRLGYTVDFNDIRPTLKLGMSAAFKPVAKDKNKKTPKGAYRIERIGELPKLIAKMNS